MPGENHLPQGRGICPFFFSVLDPESSKVTFLFQKLKVAHVQLQGSRSLKSSSSVFRPWFSCFFHKKGVKSVGFPHGRLPKQCQESYQCTVTCEIPYFSYWAIKDLSSLPISGKQLSLDILGRQWMVGQSPFPKVIQSSWVRSWLWITFWRHLQSFTRHLRKLTSQCIPDPLIL